MSNISNIFGAYTLLATPFMTEMKEIEEKQKEHREKILAEWAKSAEYPRKKKKKVRKRLELEWRIANWNIFE
jgi:capsid protein